MLEGTSVKECLSTFAEIAGEKGDYKKFNERQKKEGITGELFDASTVVAAGGADDAVPRSGARGIGVQLVVGRRRDRVASLALEKRRALRVV